ncbi:MAG: hemerythrin domain-containing protein [Candidatus Nomurabacteria bacterium]|nr:hemerythrin domain-containing protein [Candidatus Nomurabacteria bacterium]
MMQQHRNLQKDIGIALVLSKNEEIKANEINAYLKQFSLDLKEHLNLENGIFYPKLIDAMKSKGIDTLKTEDFINQMKEIGVVVTVFLEKYTEISNIEKDLSIFIKELENIISVLNLRIESEEEGVYSYWGMYK